MESIQGLKEMLLKEDFREGPNPNRRSDDYEQTTEVVCNWIIIIDLSSSLDIFKIWCSKVKCMFILQTCILP